MSEMSQIDPFTDPVAYLGALGLDCELVEYLPGLDEAA